MAFRATQPEALIVGGGIAGLAAAIGLARLGWRCTILERDPQHRRAGHGLLLPSSGHEAVQQLGLGGLEAASAPIRAFELCHRDGSLLERFPVPGSLSVLRRDLVALLREALPALVRLEAGRALRLEARGAGTFAVVDEDQKLWCADLIVAADGVHSACRSGLFPEARLTPERVTELVLSLADPDLNRELAGRCRKFQDPASGLALGLLPCRGERLVAYAQFATARHPAPGRAGEVAAFLRERFGGWNPLLERLLADLSTASSHLWHTTDLDPLPRLHCGNVVLVGDSAHPLLPFTSQGSAAALEDALCLAAALDGTDGRDAQELPIALQRYSQRRSRALQPLVQQGRALRHRFLDPSSAATAPVAPLAGFAASAGSVPGAR
jgi:salicylate hydroxylase